jgi:hypothetical protein
MLLPMMGFLFILVILGVIVGSGFAIIRPLRKWAPFVALPPADGRVSSLWVNRVSLLYDS